MFETSGLLRQTNKPALVETIVALGNFTDSQEQPKEGMHYVLDDGSLLNRIP